MPALSDPPMARITDDPLAAGPMLFLVVERPIVRRIGITDSVPARCLGCHAPLMVDVEQLRAAGAMGCVWAAVWCQPCAERELAEAKERPR
jgi:hypothetical protein